MGIQINGNTNNINAGIGSLSIEDINELDIVGVATAANFKTGVSNLHNVGLTLSGGQIDVGSNIKIGTAGVVTATSFVGSGANLTGIPAQATIANNADNRVITGGSGTNLNGEANLTFNGTDLIMNTSGGRIFSTRTTGEAALLLGSSNAGGARLYLDGDSNGDWSGNDYAYIHHDSSGDLNIVGDNPANASNIIFKTNTTTERLRITSAGELLLGTTSAYAGSNMEIRSTDAGGSTELRITNNATNANTKAGIVFTTSTGDYGTGKIFYERDAGSNSGSNYDALCFDAWSHGSAGAGGLTGNENAHMYLWGQCATGNGGQYQGLGIGTNFPANRYGGTGFNSNGAACFFAPLGSNAITLMSTSPVSGGYNDIIGINFAAHNYGTHQYRSGIYYQIKCKNGHGTYGDRGQLYLQPGYDGQNAQGQGVVFEFNGHTLPTSDNGQLLGNGSLRWSTVYAGSGSINTSDETKKQNIVGLTTSEMNAAARISKLFKTYKWKDSVTKKGDTARTHVGVTAQSIKTEMEAEGLSAAHYGFWCEDHGWYDSEGEYVGDGLTSGPGVYDELTDTTPTTVGFTSTTIYGVRYEELLAFISAYNEQRFTSLEARVAALEGS